jgi:O-antigen ligase
MSWMSYLSLGTVFGMAALFGLLIPTLVIGAQRSPAFGAGVVGAMHLIDTWFVGALALPLGLTVTPFDLAFVVLACALLMRARELPTHDRLVRLWLMACAAWFVLFVAGALLHKTRAGVEYRHYFYLSAGVTYLLSFHMTPALARRVLATVALFASGTLAIALYRWGMELFAPGLHYWQEAPGQLNWRVINAQQTFVLVTVLLTGLSALMSRTHRSSGGWWLLVPVLLAAVAALQHRTDWLVLLAGIGILVAAQRGASGGRTAATLTLLVVGVGIIAAATMVGGFGHAIQQSVAEPFKQNSTLNWRLDSWREVIRGWAAGGPSVWPLGFPFGHGWRRFIESSGQGGLNWEVSPHSFYVTTLARGGIVALGLWLAVTVVAARRHLRSMASGAADWPDGALMVTLLAAQSIFFISYSVVPMATVLIGLALSTVVHRKPQSAAHLAVPSAWRGTGLAR